MRPFARRLNSLIVRSIALLGVLALAPAVFSQQAFGPIYRGGIEQSPAVQIAPQSDAQPFVYVVAGDVHSPGVFTSSRPSITADELIETAGGSSSLYMPMVHQVVGGVRVVERRFQSEADGWEFASGDVLLVVERSGVRDARREPVSQASHVVCIGLTAQPVIVHLPEGRTAIGDLLNIVGQPHVLPSELQVLPVRVHPRVMPERIEPGTVVHFPADTVIPSAIPRGVVSAPISLDPATAASIEPQPSTASEAVVLPPPPETPAPSLLPTYSAPEQASPSPMFVPFTTEGPTAWTPSSNMYIPGSGRTMHQEPLQATPAIHEVAQSHSLTPTDSVASQAEPTVANSDTPIANEAIAPEAVETTSPLAQAAIYTGGLAVICLALAGIWTYWDRMRSLAVKRSFSQAARKSVQAQAPHPQQVNTVQALIDNRVPIIEETVETPKSLQFQGEAVGHRRLRLDRSHVLAGPHAAFATAQFEETQTAVGRGNDEESARESRQLQRAIAHLTVGQSRTARRQAATSDVVQPSNPEPIQRESALERALHQVMRKGRS